MSKLGAAVNARKLSRTLTKRSEPLHRTASGYVQSITTDADNRPIGALVQIRSSGGYSAPVYIPVAAGTNVHTGQTVTVVNNGSPSFAYWSIQGTPSSPSGNSGGEIINDDGSTTGDFETIWVKGDGTITVGGYEGYDEDGNRIVLAERSVINEDALLGYGPDSLLNVGIYWDEYPSHGRAAGDVMIGRDDDGWGSILLSAQSKKIEIRDEGETIVQFGGGVSSITGWLWAGEKAGAQVGMGITPFDQGGSGEASLIARNSYGVPQFAVETGTDNVYFNLGMPSPAPNRVEFDQGILKVHGKLYAESVEFLGEGTMTEAGSLRFEDPDTLGYFYANARYMAGHAPDVNGVMRRRFLQVWGSTSLETNPGTGVWETYVGGTQILGDRTANHFIYEPGASGGMGLRNNNTQKVWMTASGDLTVTGTAYIEAGEVGSWIIDDTNINSVDVSSNGIYISTVLGADSAPVIDVYKTGVVQARLGNYAAGKWGIYAIDADIAGWEATGSLFRSSTGLSRVELDSNQMRMSVYSGGAAKVVMGYLNNLPKNDGTGYWGSGDYGFWAASGDQLRIDGDGEYVNGDWIISHDAAYLITDASSNVLARFGNHTANSPTGIGIHIYAAGGSTTRYAYLMSDAIFVGDKSSGQYWEYTPAGGMVVRGDLAVDSIDVGTAGYVRGGLTGYRTPSSSSGFWLGYDSGYHKLFVGKYTDKYLDWTGTQLVINGNEINSTDFGGTINSSLDVGSGGYVKGGATGYNTGVGFWLGYDSTAYKFFIGNASAEKMLWTGSTLDIVGGITTDRGEIADFYITSGHLYSGSGATRVGLRPADYPFYAGSETPSAAPFYVTSAGALKASQGYVANWDIETNTLTSTSGGIVLDAANEQIELGSGADQFILSASAIRAYDGGINKGAWEVDSTFWLGPTSSNRKLEWNPDDDTFYVRGSASFDTIVWQEVLTTGGTVVVAKNGGELASAVTVTGTTFTLYIRPKLIGGSPLAAGDRCKIDNGLSSTWFTVTSVGALSNSAYPVSCTYASGTSSATYDVGCAVTAYTDADGGGYLEMTADQSGAPRYSVWTTQGSPWSDAAEVVRLGNLDTLTGMYGYGAYMRVESSLFDAIEHHWRHNEIAGTNIDYVGTKNFSSFGSVIGDDGKIDGSMKFYGGYLSATSASTLQVGSAKTTTFTGWFKFSNVSGTRYVVAKTNTSGSGASATEWYLRVSSATLQFAVSNGSSLYTATSGSINTDTWYFVYFGYDHTTDNAFIQVNNGTKYNSSTVTNPTSGSYSVTYARAYGVTSWTGTDYMWTDSVSVFNRALTSDELTALYNSGSGNDWPFSFGAGGVYAGSGTWDSDFTGVRLGPDGLRAQQKGTENIRIGSYGIKYTYDQYGYASIGAEANAMMLLRSSGSELLNEGSTSLYGYEARLDNTNNSSLTTLYGFRSIIEGTSASDKTGYYAYVYASSGDTFASGVYSELVSGSVSQRSAAVHAKATRNDLYANCNAFYGIGHSWLEADVAASTVLTLAGNTSQTSNVLEIKKGTSTVSWIDADGYPGGNLAAGSGENVVWAILAEGYNDTNGTSAQASPSTLRYTSVGTGSRRLLYTCPVPYKSSGSINTVTKLEVFYSTSYDSDYIDQIDVEYSNGSGGTTVLKSYTTNLGQGSTGSGSIDICASLGSFNMPDMPVWVRIIYNASNAGGVQFYGVRFTY